MPPTPLNISTRRTLPPLICPILPCPVGGTYLPRRAQPSRYCIATVSFFFLLSSSSSVNTLICSTTHILKLILPKLSQNSYWVLPFMSYKFDFDLTFDLDVIAKIRFSLKTFQLFQITFDFYVTHIYVVPLAGALNLYFWIGSKVNKGSFPARDQITATSSSTHVWRPILILLSQNSHWELIFASYKFDLHLTFYLDNMVKNVFFIQNVQKSFKLLWIFLWLTYMLCM